MESQTPEQAATLASLQAGASTFTVRPVAPPPHLAVVYLQSTVTVGSSGNSTIAWTAQDVLTNSSMHSTASNPSRLVPQTTGVYQIAAQVAFSAVSSGNRSVSLRDSSGGTIATARAVNAGGDAQYVHVQGYKRFDATGGYVTCDIEISGHSTMSLLNGVGITWMSLVKL